MPPSERNSCCPPDTIKPLPVVLYISPPTEPNRVPLCLFHDGSGKVGMYARLRDHLIDRTICAFFNPFFGSDRPPYNSINQMAEHYVSHLDKATHSPLILGGWSFGGVLAFQAAHYLLALGFDVRGLVLIDAPSPVDHQPLPPSIISYVTATAKSKSRSGNLTANHGGPIALQEQLEGEFQTNASLLGSYKPESLPRHGKPLKTVMLKARELFDTETLCGVKYDWLSREKAREAASREWEGLVGGRIEMWEVPGDHFAVFEGENIGETAAQLWKACRYIER